MDPSARNFEGFYIGFREVVPDLKSPPPDGNLISIHPSKSASLSSSSSSSLQSRSMYSFKTIDLPHKSFPMRTDFHVVLNELRRNTRYGIIVQAFNRKGSGPASDEVLLQTAEFGMCSGRRTIDAIDRAGSCIRCHQTPTPSPSARDQLLEHADHDPRP